jgi:hypothetical protein
VVAVPRPVAVLPKGAGIAGAAEAAVRDFRGLPRNICPPGTL